MIAFGINRRRISVVKKRIPDTPTIQSLINYRKRLIDKDIELRKKQANKHPEMVTLIK
jgi:hypothetical protein